MVSKRFWDRFPALVTVGLLAAASGCISTHCVREKAMAHETYDVETGEDKPVQGQPGYYLLLPLTVAADLATSPLQIGFYLYTSDAGSAQASIYNVPIALK